MGAPRRVSGWPLPRLVQKLEPPAVSSWRILLMIATFATHAAPGAFLNLGGSAAWVAQMSPRAMTVVVAVVTTGVAAGAKPWGVRGGAPGGGEWWVSGRRFRSSRGGGTSCPLPVCPV